MEEREAENDQELSRSELSADDGAPRRFGLAWWMAAPLAFFVAGEVWLHRLKVAESAAKTADLVIILATGVAAALLLAWLVWKLGRTSRGLTTAIFSGLLMLFVLGAVANRDRQAELLAQRISNEVLGQDRTTQNQLSQLDAKLRVAGLGPDKLTSIDAIDQRLKLLEAVGAQAASVSAKMQILPGELRRQLAENKVHSRQIDRVVARVLRRMQYDQALEARRAEVDLLALLRENLGFLKKNWGLWQYDKTADTVKFTDPALDKEHEALTLKIRETGSTLARLSSELDRARQ